MSDGKKYKNMTFGFYVSGQADQTEDLPTESLFQSAHSAHSQFVLNGQSPWLEDLGDGRIVKISSILYDANSKSYRGAISRVRIETLPYIGRSNGAKENKITIGGDDEVWERSYFCYFVEDDILVFQENLIGPKVSDLEAILFSKAGGAKEKITFESIWKSSAIHDLLNNKCTYKKVEISVALPRKFNKDEMTIDNPWTKTIVDMMTNVGMSRLNLVFFGRASTKKGIKGYINDSVGESIKYMLEKFGTIVGSPEVKKAKLTPSSGSNNEVNLLDEKIKSKVRLVCENGYESEDDVFNKMLAARRDKDTELRIYRR